MANDPRRSLAARTTTLALLDARATGATACPSEVARRIAEKTGIDWREAMPAVHAAVDALLAEGSIELSWKGAALTERAGPYRLARRTG